MKKVLLSSLLLSLLTLLAKGEEIKTQKVGLFVFRAPKFPVELYVQSAEGYAKVRIGGASTTRPNIMVNPDGVLRFYGEPSLNEEGLPVYPVVGKVKASSDWSQAFVVLTGVKKDDKTAFTGTSFPLNKNDFPDGSIKFANLSNLPVRGVIGQTKSRIRPQELKTIKFKDPKGKTIPVVFQYFHAEDKRWCRMMSTKWAVPETGRTLLFAYREPKSGIMTSKSVPIRW